MISFLHKYRLDHIAFGLLLMAFLFAPITFITQDAKATLWIAWFGQSLYWLGREIRDTEIRLQVELPREWAYAWNPSRWSHDTKLDLLYPVIGIGLLVALITF